MVRPAPVWCDGANHAKDLNQVLASLLSPLVNQQISPERSADGA